MARKPLSSLSLGTQVVLALVLGLVCGLFFGEQAEFMRHIGRAFILLLQMTVLPYIVLSLITGLGHLTYAQVKELALKAGSLLLLSWGLAAAVIIVMPLAFPVWESASFFSTSLIEMPERINYLQLFIPANPFFSLANNVVPAVVLFSIALGLALIGIEQKQSLLDLLSVLNRAMGQVTRFVSKLTPLGVFGIIASASGTMGLEELGKLQVYLLTYIAMALVLTLWVLPAIITSLSPLTYGQVVGQTRDIMVTAFATGSAIIVLPLLIERCKELLRQGNLHTAESDATVEVIIPAFTSFPKIGTLLPMSFVLFAGWFAGSAVPVAQYPSFLFTGLVSFFGGVNVAIPMLLDLLRIPVDLFQLYLALTVLTNRFGVLLTTMNILMLALLGACAVCGLLTIQWGRLLRNAVLTLVVMAVTIGATRSFFTLVLDNEYRQDEIIAGMQLLRQAGPATVYKTAPPALPHTPQTSTWERIRTRGAIRVGYLPDNLPFAYFNAAGDLVGFDIDMAHALARDLGVQLEFVPIARQQMAEQVNTGYCDLVMSGTPVTPQRAQVMAFSDPYVTQTVALIVKDHRRDDFNSRNAIRQLKAPRIGVPNLPYYIDKVKRYLPQAEVVVLNSIDEFFATYGDQLDAFVYSAEAGSAWSLLYPDYTVAIPQPDILSMPTAYPVARGNQELVDFLNVWIELKRQDKTLQGFYDYWILGRNAVPTPPRWSVIRNVLHWTE